jgi:hypothetical protein
VPLRRLDQDRLLLVDECLVVLFVLALRVGLVRIEFCAPGLPLHLPEPNL